MHLHERAFIYYCPKDAGGIPSELPPSKEQWRLHFGGMTVSGKSGTGKTKTVEKLAERLGVNPERNVKTGQLFRKEVANEVGFMQRDLAVDRRLDEMQKEFITTADVQNPFILEGRLAGFLASQIDTSVPVVRVLFTAEKHIREERLHRRHLETDPSLTLGQVKKQSRQRDRKDLEQWRKIHPQLQDKDPFDPNLKDEDNRAIYDIVVSTSYRSVNQVVDYIVEQLETKGVISRKPEEIN